TCGVAGHTPVFTSDPPVNVSPTGTASSGSQTVANVGTYQWTASYSGDAHNNPVTEGCGGDHEQTVVTNLPTPTLSTNAESSASTGASVTDTATLAGFVPGAATAGHITFDLWNTPTCSGEGALVGSSTVDVISSPVTSGAVGPVTAAGTYYWTASYTGDAKNNPVSEACGGLDETTTVTAPTVVFTPPPTSPGLTITKSVNQTTLVAPGLLTYTVVVANPGTAPATNVVVTDANPPNTLFESLSQAGTVFSCTTPAVNTAGTISCTAPSLAAGASTTFTIVDEVTAAADGTTVINTAIAAATGLTPPPATVTTVIPAPPVTAPSVAPELAITKSVNDATLVAPAELTYTVVVSNPGSATATDVVMTDPNPPNTLFESLSQTGPAFTCTTPAVNTAGLITCTAPSLAAGASTTFTIVDEVTAAADGTTVVNTATATATGLTPPPASAQTVIPVPPVAVLATNASQAPTAVRAASTLPLTGTDVRGLLAAGIGLILCGLGLFAKSARMEPKRT
ncbi:MAG TPA: hypothetical protein VGI06_02025, partial [Acidimicrobiales bacterium]